MKLYLLLIGVIIVAGCVEQDSSIREVVIPGHAEIYTFSNDLRDVLEVPINDPAGIREQFFSNKVNFVFDGSSRQDNAYFTVTMTNIMAKVPAYMAYEGRIIEFTPYYFIGDLWYDRKGEEIERPEFQGPVLWLKGPSTGAEDTSVNIENATITVQGTDYGSLVLAGDRLVLAVMKIDAIPKA
ncbi:MAG: hypothetical protein HYT73_01205 [Candidatus Aenigmarchaeota archaeon]|nr:hypothetical protein [Candidatus Aenigmarchaeota archaeon]